MIKAVIFDSDGMLTHGPRFSEVYASEQKISVELMTPFFTGPFENCLIGKADLKEELQKGWLEKWSWTSSVDDFLKYWFSVGDRLDKEILDTVPQVQAKGVRCVLAINQEKYRTEYLSGKFNYRNIFEEIFSSAYVGYKKPFVEFYDAVFEYFKKIDPAVKKEEIFFWDDDDENIEGAGIYGLQTEIFKNTKDYKEKMKTLGLL